MLSTNEDLGHATLPVAVLQPLLQFLVVELVHVDVLGHHANAQVVEEVQDVAALFESRTNTAKRGDVQHHFPSFCIELK